MTQRRSANLPIMGTWTYAKDGMTSSEMMTSAQPSWVPLRFKTSKRAINNTRQLGIHYRLILAKPLLTKSDRLR
jgi:hypothetical protein